MTDISSQATCPPDSSTLIPTENIIEDIFAFTNDFWSVPGNHNGPLVRHFFNHALAAEICTEVSFELYHQHVIRKVVKAVEY